MESELASLESKISRVVEQCNQLRSENQQLRQQLAMKSDENKRLAEKIDEARRRLEQLLVQLPE
jgi:cell division protein ZapB